MVHYIRFLKPPKLDTQKCIVRALVTITTDLGDYFYPADIDLYAAVITDASKESDTKWEQILWKRGTRNTWIEIRKTQFEDKGSIRLLVSTQSTLAADIVLLSNLLEILSARCEVFEKEKPEARDRVERRYRTSLGNQRAIYEDTGESISRHIWDAGIALTAFLSNIVLQPPRSSVVANVLTKTKSHGPSVLELGSGCGIVGLEIAQNCSQCDVILTDLPDAMENLSYNVSKVMRSNLAVGNVVTAVLDWDDANSKIIKGHRYDLVIVSDCTYNADSIPALVRTLAAVIDEWPAALIVVSMKVRHDSEAVFFDLMAAAGFVIAEHSAITLPDQQRADSGQELEVVDIYVFGSN